jgi:hypothetical protein
MAADGRGNVKMKNFIVVLFITLMVVPSLVLNTGLAQPQSGRESPKVVQITGCLVKGDEPGEVWLAQKDGRIYGLEGETIDLNAHLGQKVMVTGYVLPEGKDGTGEETQKENKAGKRESADFRVRTLKMISKTCTQ